jgi:hypothetical protein
VPESLPGAHAQRGVLHEQLLHEVQTHRGEEPGPKARINIALLDVISRVLCGVNWLESILSNSHFTSTAVSTMIIASEIMAGTGGRDIEERTEERERKTACRRRE